MDAKEYFDLARKLAQMCTEASVRSAISRGYYAAFHVVEGLGFTLPKDAAASWQYRPYPWVAAVSGTNFCHIGLDIDEKRNRLVVFSVLDSIGKGGAHAGVQNLNLLFGLPEKTGLERYGLHPSLSSPL